MSVACFCFNAPATTEIYTLSLHDALPILDPEAKRKWISDEVTGALCRELIQKDGVLGVDSEDKKDTFYGFLHLTFQEYLTRSEEHTSELQSHSDLVCRLLLEKKKNNKKNK